MYAPSIERRISLALTEDGDVRTAIVTNIHMNLSTLAVIFRLSPYLMGCRKMLYSFDASAGLQRFGYLFIPKG
jgi:hypothetical protein